MQLSSHVIQIRELREKGLKPEKIWQNFCIQYLRSRNKTWIHSGQALLGYQNPAYVCAQHFARQQEVSPIFFQQMDVFFRPGEIDQKSSLVQYLRALVFCFPELTSSLGERLVAQHNMFLPVESPVIKLYMQNCLNWFEQGDVRAGNAVSSTILTLAKTGFLSESFCRMTVQKCLEHIFADGCDEAKVVAMMGVLGDLSSIVAEEFKIEIVDRLSARFQHDKQPVLDGVEKALVKITTSMTNETAMRLFSRMPETVWLSFMRILCPLYPGLTATGQLQLVKKLEFYCLYSSAAQQQLATGILNDLADLLPVRKKVCMLEDLIDTFRDAIENDDMEGYLCAGEIFSQLPAFYPVFTAENVRFPELLNQIPQFLLAIYRDRADRAAREAVIGPWPDYPPRILRILGRISLLVNQLQAEKRVAGYVAILPEVGHADEYMAETATETLLALSGGFSVFVDHVDYQQKVCASLLDIFSKPKTRFNSKFAARVLVAIFPWLSGEQQYAFFRKMFADVLPKCEKPYILSAGCLLFGGVLSSLHHQGLHAKDQIFHAITQWMQQKKYWEVRQTAVYAAKNFLLSAEEKYAVPLVRLLGALMHDDPVTCVRLSAAATLHSAFSASDAVTEQLQMSSVNMLIAGLSFASREINLNDLEDQLFAAKSLASVRYFPACCHDAELPRCLAETLDHHNSEIRGMLAIVLKSLAETVDDERFENFLGQIIPALCLCLLQQQEMPDLAVLVSEIVGQCILRMNSAQLFHYIDKLLLDKLFAAMPEVPENHQSCFFIQQVIVNVSAMRHNRLVQVRSAQFVLEEKEEAPGKSAHYSYFYSKKVH